MSVGVEIPDSKGIYPYLLWLPSSMVQHFIVFVPGNPEKTSVARDSPFNTVATS